MEARDQARLHLNSVSLVGRGQTCGADINYHSPPRRIPSAIAPDPPPPRSEHCVLEGHPDQPHPGLCLQDTSSPPDVMYTACLAGDPSHATTSVVFVPWSAVIDKRT